MCCRRPSDTEAGIPQKPPVGKETKSYRAQQPDGFAQEKSFWAWPVPPALPKFPSRSVSGALGAEGPPFPPPPPSPLLEMAFVLLMSTLPPCQKAP